MWFLFFLFHWRFYLRIWIYTCVHVWCRACFFSSSLCRRIGRGVMPSVKLALDHVNEHSDILSNYRLHMWWNDTQVNNTFMIDFVYRSVCSIARQFLLIAFVFLFILFFLVFLSMLCSDVVSSFVICRSSSWNHHPISVMRPLAWNHFSIWCIRAHTNWCYLVRPVHMSPIPLLKPASIGIWRNYHTPTLIQCSRATHFRIFFGSCRRRMRSMRRDWPYWDRSIGRVSARSTKTSRAIHCRTIIWWPAWIRRILPCWRRKAFGPMWKMRWKSCAKKMCESFWAISMSIMRGGCFAKRIVWKCMDDRINGW